MTQAAATGGDMSAFDLFDCAWSRRVDARKLAPPASPPPSSATGSISDDYTPSGSISPVSTFKDEPAEPFIKAPIKPAPQLQQPALRTVHKISPLPEFTPERVLGFTKPAPVTIGFALPKQQQPQQPKKQQPPSQLQPLQLAPPAFKPAPLVAALQRESRPAAAATKAAKAADASNPVPIPGALQDSLARSRSLIKAVPPQTAAPVAIKRNIQRGWPAQDMAPAVGSWADRQTRFTPNHPSQQPSGLGEALKARNAAIKARRAASSQTARAPVAPEEVAWRIRFKRKWIKEELCARKMDFPDDPSYEDEWEEAQRFLEACGPETALQAAFLQTAAGSDSEDDALLASADALLFPDDEPPAGSLSGAKSIGPASRSGSNEAEVAAKAAALVRLHRKIAAAA